MHSDNQVIIKKKRCVNDYLEKKAESEIVIGRSVSVYSSIEGYRARLKNSG